MTERQITHIRDAFHRITLCGLGEGINSISYEHAVKNPVKHVDSLLMCEICTLYFLDLETERSRNGNQLQGHRCGILREDSIDVDEKW